MAALTWALRSDSSRLLVSGRRINRFEKRGGWGPAPAGAEVLCHITAAVTSWSNLLRAEMSQTELVAMLRSRARKSGTQTSHFRGVSLLKQTGKWHAQINVGGKQVRRACMQATCRHCMHARRISGPVRRECIHPSGI